MIFKNWSCKRDNSYCKLEKIWIWILIFLLKNLFCTVLSNYQECITGNFTDIQHWAFENGSLNTKINSSNKLDLSGKPDFLIELRLLMSEDEESDIKSSTFSRSQVTKIENYTMFTLYSGQKIRGKIALKNVYYLSLARNGLERIPLFYTDSLGVSNSYWKHLKYLSLYGNLFYADSTKLTQNVIQYSVTLNVSSPKEVIPKYYFSYPTGKSNWAADLSRLDFSNLLELDLRNCSIEILHDDTFISLPKLRRLYLEHNMIHTIFSNAFDELSQLVHLDISNNHIKICDNDTQKIVDGTKIMKGAFTPLVRLKSLDFSFTKIAQPSLKAFEDLSSSVERLSLCYTKFPTLRNGIFNKTSLKILDISGNVAMDQIDYRAFIGIENTIEVLYAKRLGIKNLKPFENLNNLAVLSLAENDISFVEAKNFIKLKKLRIIDLSDNRITNWNHRILNNENNLEIVRLNKNNLNLLTIQMLADFSNLKYLSLGENSFVCNCYVRCFIDGVKKNSAYGQNIDKYPNWYTNVSKNEQKFENPKNEDLHIILSENITFHNVFIYFSTLIDNIEKNSSLSTPNSLYSGNGNCFGNEFNESLEEFIFASNFSFQLLDYVDDNYLCIDSKLNRFEFFSNVNECENKESEHNTHQRSISVFILLSVIIVIIVLTFVVIIIWKWWYVRYFFLMMKNIAILSLSGKSNNNDASDNIYTYDVFVSYCEEDRDWVLKEFLPNIENQSEISVCLHERDFQVGLSIFENIISCMDRSRSLLMVVSNQFLMSQWCQFEMHLAQHRLLETRREQLILVLLEDIPRRKRPNTLHYLMLTKTYIIWPKNKNEYNAFWKRLTKSITYGKTCIEQHSVA